MGTIRDVAKLSGVSVSTVSRVINQSPNVSKHTESKVKKAIKELNYNPSSLARGLVSKRTYTIGLMVPDITNPFYPELARAVSDTAGKFGYSVILINSDGSSKKSKEYIKIMKNKYVDGVIFASHPITQSEIEDLKQFNLPFVITERELGTENTISTIKVNNYEGAEIAVKHLLSIGCTHIAHISGPKNSITYFDRYSGYVDTLKKHHQFNENYIVQAEFNIKSGEIATKALLESHPNIDGIFAANDLIAVGALKTMIRMGKQVPEDIALIGFDGISFTTATVPEISTIAQPIYEVGLTAVKRLIGLIENREDLKMNENQPLKVKLICRESTDRASLSKNLDKSK